MKTQVQKLRIIVGLWGFVMGALPLLGRSLDYQQTRKGDQVDDDHGTKVADPHRWLEDDNSPETAKWAEAVTADI